MPHRRIPPSLRNAYCRYARAESLNDHPIVVRCRRAVWMDTGIGHAGEALEAEAMDGPRTAERRRTAVAHGGLVVWVALLIFVS